MERASIAPEPPELAFPRLPVRRMVTVRQAIGMTLLLVSLLTGCAVRAPRSMSVVPESDLTAADGRLLVTAWQQRLSDYVGRFGSGDPAVLSSLPALRSTGTLRPARITFGSIGIERDGFDVQGLLLGKHVNTTGTWYVFVVGVIERRGYRPASIADVRLAAMSVRDGALVWETGASDVQSLAHYRRAADAGATLRFPADKDLFGMVSCPASVCAEEAGSGARWTLQFSADAAALQAMQ